MFWFLGLFLRPFGLLHSSSVNTKYAGCSLKTRWVLLSILLAAASLNAIYHTVKGAFVLWSTSESSAADAGSTARICSAFTMVPLSIRAVLVLAVQFHAVRKGKLGRMLAHFDALLHSSLSTSGIRGLRRRISWISLLYSFVLVGSSASLFILEILTEKKVRESSTGSSKVFLPFSEMTIPFSLYLSLQVICFFVPYCLSVFVTIFLGVHGILLQRCVRTQSKFLKMIYANFVSTGRNLTDMHFEERVGLGELSGEMDKLMEERAKSHASAKLFSKSCGPVVLCAWTSDLVSACGFIALSCVGHDGTKSVLEYKLIGLLLAILLLLLPYLPLVKVAATVSGKRHSYAKKTWEMFAHGKVKTLAHRHAGNHKDYTLEQACVQEV